MSLFHEFCEKNGIVHDNEMQGKSNSITNRNQLLESYEEIAL